MDTIECCEGGSVSVNNILTTRLSRKRERLEAELGLVKRAETLLTENPTLKELFDIVSQVRGI
ncbi:hypothetical protein CL634_06900 [bacterium]|nr:hypothetical protein [bacterium]